MNLNELNTLCGDPLVERNNAGIYVALFYDRKGHEVFVFYNDVKTGLSFSIDPPLDKAMDAYNHPIPYADAALNGKNSPVRVRLESLVAV